MSIPPKQPVVSPSVNVCQALMVSQRRKPNPNILILKGQAFQNAMSSFSPSRPPKLYEKAPEILAPLIPPFSFFLIPRHNEAATNFTHSSAFLALRASERMAKQLARHRHGPSTERVSTPLGQSRPAHHFAKRGIDLTEGAR